MEIAWVTERIAVGTAIETSVDVTVLLTHGVTCVINCRSEYDDAPLLHDTDMDYIWHGTPDWDIWSGKARTPIPIQWFKEGIQAVLIRLAASSHHRFYIHCRGGLYRSPSLVYAILRAFGVDQHIARGLIVTARPPCVMGINAAPEADAAIAGGW